MTNKFPAHDPPGWVDSTNVWLLPMPFNPADTMEALTRFCLSLDWLAALTTGLTGCRPPEEEFPKGTTLQLVLAQDQPLKPVYFWEDSLQRQTNFELYYYDQNQFFRPLPQPAQFLINGQPLAGNAFVFPAPGQYTVSARLNNRTSDNQLTINQTLDHQASVAAPCEVAAPAYLVKLFR